MKFTARAAAAALALLTLAVPAMAEPAKHNVLIFVADGLRYVSVTPKTAPTMWRLKTQGVDFTNSHSLYPTLTTVNASAIATGHYIGDTGDFGNTIYVGAQSGKPRIVGLENDTTLGEVNALFGGNYLNETSLLTAASKDYATAVMGKVGPAAIQAVTERDGTGTLVMDDGFGASAPITVPKDVLDAIKAAGLPAGAPGIALPNVEQQKYMIAVATKVVLPRLVATKKPFVMLYWSRDPDITQHAQSDSKVPSTLTPGINGDTSKAAIKNADDCLAALIAALKAQGLDKTTDIFVTADHGFSTIDHGNSQTSAAAKLTFKDVPPGETPSGFLSMDIANALDLPLADASGKTVNYKNGEIPTGGSGLIGTDPAHPDVIVAQNGGSDLIYTGANKTLTAKLVDFLTTQDTISGIFVNDALGDIPGALAMSSINWRGTARTPQPDIVVSFASHAIAGCKPPLLMCAAEMVDNGLKTSQGMHGTLSRSDTRNFQAAFGPSFKSHYADPTPISNADITPTLAHVLGLTITPKGGLTGRVITEAFKGAKPVKFTHKVARSLPAANGKVTVLQYQEADGRHYFDAAGFKDHTVGLTAK